MGDAQRQSLEELSAWASASDPHTGRPRNLQFDIFPTVTFVTIAAASLSAQRPRFGEPYTEAEFVTFCSSYPILAGSTGDLLPANPRCLRRSDNPCKYVEHGLFRTVMIQESSAAAIRGRTSAMTTDTSSPLSEVISRHFTPCSHGGPFCLRSRCWPDINLIRGRITSTSTRAPPCRWRRFLIEPFLHARSSCSMPSDQ